jgi:hypothetical protein
VTPNLLFYPVLNEAEALAGVADGEVIHPTPQHRKGNCWDDACSETLFASLKVERLHGEQFKTIRQAKDETLAWLLWYNRTRMHSTLNYVSPMQFEQDWINATAKTVA